MARNLSRGQANGTLKAIKKQFAAWVDESTDIYPELREDWGDYRWVIVWESGAPYEWALLAGQGGIEEEFGFKVAPARLPKNVFVEPVNGSVLALYPA